MAVDEWGNDIPDYVDPGTEPTPPTPDPVYDYSPPGEPAPVDQVNYTPSGDEHLRHDSGELAPVDQPQYSPQGSDFGPPTEEQQAQAQYNHLGQTLGDQPQGVQDLFGAQYGEDAAGQWATQSVANANTPLSVQLPPLPRPPVPDQPKSNGPDDFWVEDDRERRHWVNGQVVERVPKAHGGVPVAKPPPVVPPAKPAPNGQIYNYSAEQAADAHAKAALDREYTRYMMATGNDKFAFEKAKQAYQQTYNQQLLEARAREQEQVQRQHQDTTAVSLMQLLSGLRGPGNAFRYASTLAGMPNGLRDLIAAASGRFQLPAFGGGLSAAQAGGGVAGLSGLLGDVAAGGVSGSGLSPADLAALPAGNQLNAANMQHILKNPYSRDLFSGMYEAGGQDPQKVIADYLASLPYQGGPQQGRVAGLL